MADPLTDRQRDLAGRHWPEALRLAGLACRRWPTGPEPHDVATRAVMNAARAWEPGRPFLPLLQRCVGFAWADLAKSAAGKPGFRPKAHHYGLDGRHLFASGDEPACAGLDSQDSVEWLCGLLPAREGETLRRMHLQAGCGEVRQVARALGVEKTMAHRDAQRGRSRLRERLADYGAK